MTRRSHTRQLLALVLVATLPLAAGQAGCATGSGDDTSQSSGIPTGSSTALAPGSSSPSGSSTNPNNYGYMGDASSPGNSGAGDSAATSPASSFDAAAPPSGPVGACDTNNAKYLLELFTTPDAGTCPCSAAECCFSGLVCLPE